MDDQDKALEEMLEIVRGIEGVPTKATCLMDVVKFTAALDRVDRLCELVRRLHDHLSHGGALPKAWQRQGGQGR